MSVHLRVTATLKNRYPMVLTRIIGGELLCLNKGGELKNNQTKKSWL